MQQARTGLPEMITTAEQRPTSRRGFLRGTTLAGGAVAAVVAASPALNNFRAVSAQQQLTDEVDVLNYALTLEHLQTAFYRDGLALFTGQDFLDIGFDTSVFDYLALVGEHEAIHVDTLVQAITDFGGTPVQEAQYDFGYTNLPEFLIVGQALENTGVDAYTGAAQFLVDNDAVLTTALTIHGSEARHASYLNILNDASPFPDAFDDPLTPEEVLEFAGPFIVAGDIAVPDATPVATPIA